MYTIKQFINDDLIITCRYIQAKHLANHLKNEGVNTEVIDCINICCGDTYYIFVTGNHATIIYPDVINAFEKNYKIIEFNELEIPYELYLDEDKDFVLKEIVHLVIPKEAEPFNLFKKDEHVTAYVTAIDKANKMYEVIYLHERNISLWVPGSWIFHINHLYTGKEEKFND